MPKYLYLVISILLFGACENEDQNKINQITQALQEDLDLSDIRITNAVDVLQESSDLFLSTEIVDVDTSNDTSLVAPEQDDLEKTEILQYTDVENIEVDDGVNNKEETSTKIIEIVPDRVSYEVATRDNEDMAYQRRMSLGQTKVRSSSYLNTIQQDSYIKIGKDRPNISVGRGNTQKITTVVFVKNRAVMVDVYLFAIPIRSPLVRNYNTLIGYAKNLELINGQSQFTRYWNGRRSNGSYLRPGNYNVYVEYQYKNARGQIIYKMGRYWGGNHRRWKAIVL